MIHTAASMAASYTARFAQPGTVDLQAGAEDPKPFPEANFGGDDVVEEIHAASVLSFNNAGKLVNAKVITPFLIGGNTAMTDDIVELPEAEFKRMGPAGTGQVVEATDDDIAAAQKKAAKTK